MLPPQNVLTVKFRSPPLIIKFMGGVGNCVESNQAPSIHSSPWAVARAQGALASYPTQQLGEATAGLVPGGVPGVPPAPPEDIRANRPEPVTTAGAA